ncbi:alcohol dehydrogenase catalytic domain-containing protein [Parafrankia soli]|uniref:alcohol dehydrogenase catalytic domain-containing protein n=1 Tax=Parafrankia soli TaxID=2599596 RepID=UPI001F51D604|nr:alcohol dehydrogenase catalytic domain-containing protein [Parafrankia soli]
MPSGGVFPTVPGHEIVGRIEQISPAAAAEFSVQEGDRVGVRSYVATADGRSRVYGFGFPVDEASGLFGGYADYMELVPGSEVQKLRDDLPATELTVYECLSNSATFVRPAEPGESLLVLGPGHMGVTASLAVVGGARGPRL